MSFLIFIHNDENKFILEKMTLINNEEWKAQNPNKCAIIKLNPEQEGTVYLVEQSPRSGEEAFKSHFNLQYGGRKDIALFRRKYRDRIIETIYENSLIERVLCISC